VNDMAEMKFRGAGIEEVNHGPARVRTGHDQLLPVIQANELRMVQSPAGTSQRKFPSPPIFFVRSTTSLALAMMFDLLFGTASTATSRQVDWAALLIPRTAFRQLGKGSASWNLAGPVTVVVE